MAAAPTFDAVFTVMRAAAGGDHDARVPLPAQPDMEDAATELATALAAKPTGVVLFYAHLFAGRSAQALGKLADADKSKLRELQEKSRSPAAPKK